MFRGKALKSAVMVAIVSVSILINAPPALADGRQVYRQAIKGTALVIASPNGGTGFLVDRERKLLLTAHHVVAHPDTGRVPEQVKVVFPVFDDGRPVAEKKYYKDRMASLAVRGKVFDTDAEHDLALIVLDTVPEDAVALKLAKESPWAGDTVHAVGNPSASDAFWVYNVGAVRQVYRFESMLDGVQRVAARVIETQNPLNPGDSGGALLNDAGEVVGVHCCIINKIQVISESIDLSEIKTFLAGTEPMLTARTAAELTNRAEHYLKRGRSQMAMADLDAAVKLDARASLPLRARLNNNLGRFSQAMADCDETLKLHPECAVTLAERARTHNGLGEFGAAIADADAALKIDPCLAAAYVQRACAERVLGRMDEALADFDEAVKLDAAFATAFKSRAALHVQMGQAARAMEDLNEAVRLAPGDAEALYRRAALHLDQGDADAALSDLDKAVVLDRAFAEAHELRADVLVLAKEYDAAMRSYRLAYLTGGDKATTERVMKKALEAAARKAKEN